ncbi:ferric reductase like transmembrane component-domain-containing protein [Colletotrichum navitas]|uniref:Ferric reductase like transmembrane component-domain-containing protein n=1 Tax=Colletotrichum navitas TaxID=681940 RepID=A0AAD8PM70_9PEZI|nr:ferric reductase like transmembrane component-domain-containing protein [Colletotrichum navitas]KAK1569919.1 ferric reductase like transmembrane component-domain-containing protein [Colletotrichum navitas]
MGCGQSWYDPRCAYACRAVIGSAPLDCPDTDAGGMTGMDMHKASPMAPCIADNVDFLSTLAYCMGERCVADGVSASKLEAYWADQATGDPTVPPHWTYGAVLANITLPPNRTFETGDTLNYTAFISAADYQYQYDFDRFFDWEEAVQSTYVIVIICVGVGSPIMLSALKYLPFMTGAIDRLKPYLVYPIGGYNIRPLPHLLGNPPTAGQGLWIAMFVTLNIVLGAITYRNFQYVHPWGFTKTAEILAYVGYRTGHISFALLPLTVLFSSRNNVLIWLTDWPFSTFLVLHRWVARLCAAHAIWCKCGGGAYAGYLSYTSTGTYYTDVHKPYWIWGIVATLCLVILLFQSVVWFRRASYEVFLVLHILLAVFTVAGCWYHVYYWKGLTGVYELWLYMVCAVWFFDRLVRVLRLAKNGVRRADVAELSADIVRVDIHGLRWSAEPGYHAYVYFPTLQPLRPWENHPFSIIQTALLRPRKHSLASAQTSSHSGDAETNKSPKVVVVAPSLAGTDGISIYIKKHRGMTSFLQERVGLPVLLDGPYWGNLSRDVLKCDRVLLVGGGIGITGLLTWTRAHVNVKLCWSLRETSCALLQDLEPALDNIPDKVVLVGQRLDIEALLVREVEAGWKKVGVVVCGPAGLCDDTRMAVVRVGKRVKVIFELEVDAFSW